MNFVDFLSPVNPLSSSLLKARGLLRALRRARSSSSKPKPALELASTWWDVAVALAALVLFAGALLADVFVLTYLGGAVFLALSGNALIKRIWPQLHLVYHLSRLDRASLEGLSYRELDCAGGVFAVPSVSGQAIWLAKEDLSMEEHLLVGPLVASGLLSLRRFEGEPRFQPNPYAAWAVAEERARRSRKLEEPGPRPGPRLRQSTLAERLV